jgi:hypothetical protein
MLRLNSAAKWAILLGAVSLSIVVCILVWVQDGGRKLTILDKRFHISKFVVTRGPTYTVYPQGALKSRAREQLSEWGLPVGAPAKCTLGILPKSCAFFVHYSLDSFPPELAVNALEAELVDRKGVAIPLRWFAGGSVSSPKTYYGGWSLDAAPRSTNDCLFRLKLKTNSTPVAEVVINKL